MREQAIELALSDGAFFGVPHLHGFKVGYAFLTPAEMDQAIGVLARELHRLLALPQRCVRIRPPPRPVSLLRAPSEEEASQHGRRAVICPRATGSNSAASAGGAPLASLLVPEGIGTMAVEKMKREETIGRLTGKRVAVLAADGFEHVELSVPVKALRAEGAAVHVVSLHHGKIRGMNVTEPARTVEVDHTLDEVSSEHYDALLLPGGFISPDFLRQSRAARDFVRAFDVANKPIATICHGPWVLVSAELVSGRRLAAWPGIRDDIDHAGGTWRDEPVVRDRNWVSSRGPQDLQVFVPAMIELFAAGTWASLPVAEGVAELELASSPKSEEPSALAVGAARILPGPTIRTAAALAAGTALGVWASRRAAH